MEKARQSGVGFYEIRDRLRAAMKAELDADKIDIDTHGPLSKEDEFLLRGDQYFCEDYLQTGKDDVGELDGHLHRFLGDQGISVDPDLYDQLKKMMAEARLSMRRTLLDYNARVTTIDLAEVEPVRELPSADRATVDEVAAKSGVSLAEATDLYLAERNRAGIWRERPKEEKIKHLDLLKEALGSDRPVDTIAMADVRRIKKIVGDYPLNRKKNPLTRDLSLAEAVALAGVPKINVQTVNKYLQTYSDLFAYLSDNGHVSGNVFATIKVKSAKNSAKGGRTSYSLDQMAMILKAVTADPGVHYTKPHQKWGVLIAAFTGARLNEIAQLQVADIVKIDNVLCFSFNDDGEYKQLKNKSSNRIVPVHSQLLALGFSDYVEIVKKKGSDRLFPALTYTPKEGWGRGISRWYNDRFLVALGIKTKELVFHSFRHTFYTMLTQADVDGQMIQDLVGHEKSTVGGQVYFHGYKIEQKRDSIEKLRYDF